jgi:hypothetical protein
MQELIPEYQKTSGHNIKVEYDNFGIITNSDLLWRQIGRMTVTWEMNGGTKLANINLNAISTDWHIQGIGDFSSGKVGSTRHEHLISAPIPCGSRQRRMPQAKSLRRDG